MKEGEPVFDWGKDASGNNYFNINSSIYKNGQELFKIIYPIGSIYMSANSTDPKNLFGGTWERLKGGFLYGAVSSYGTGNSTGTVTNASSGNTGSTTLTVDQIPSHTHGVNLATGGTQTLSGFSWEYSAKSRLYNMSGSTDMVRYTGGGKGHTHSLNSHTHNIPYMAVFVWRRTA